MIIATWNVNSITVRLEQVLQWLKDNRPNVLCLQEIKVTDEKFPVKAFQSLGYYVEVSGEKTYNGVAIISDKPLVDVHKGFEQEIAPGSKRLIAGSYESIRIIDVYIPNGSEIGSEKYAYKLAWIKELRMYLETKYSLSSMLVLCGDFNVAPEDRDVYDPKALEGSILVSELERKALEDVRQWGLVDVFRLHHQESGLYSWWDYRMNSFARKMGLRIDHIWATKSLAEKSRSIHIDKEARKQERPSDHAPVMAEFVL